jgi:ATP-binding cassette subfamily B protein
MYFFSSRINRSFAPRPRKSETVTKPAKCGRQADDLWPFASFRFSWYADMKILFSYLRPYRWMILVTLLLATVNQVFSLFDPYIFQRYLDSLLEMMKLTSGNETGFIHLTTIWFFMALGTAMVSRIAKNFQDYFMNVVIQKAGVNIYTDGLRHSLELPYFVFEDQRSGETLSRLQKVRTDMERLISSFINILFVSIVSVVFIFVYTIRIDWRISVIYFLSIPLLFVVSSYLGKKIKTIQKKIVSETIALAGSTTESLRNIELIKSLGLASQEIKRLNSTTLRILVLELKKIRFVRSLGFIQGTFVNLVRNMLLLFLLYLLFHNVITLPKLFALQIYSFFIFGPLQEMGNLITVYRETEVSLGNFMAIMSTPKEAKPAQPVEIQGIKEIEFKNVVFQHQTSANKAVDGISFHVKHGETIAFVGPSGSGKTTLIKLLVGLYQPASGEVLYNTISGKEVDLDQLRNQIGLVTQDTQLFSGSIKENLLFVNPLATDEECMDVLHKAACKNLLARADKGLDTLIGEGGVKVSGGEKQRLSIARALLRKPRLIVFDEATSSLDSLTEEEITTTIRDVSQGTDRITIMIAHRLSTIMHADHIFVLEHGKLAESGRHEDLLNSKGLYYAMWRQQIGERK